ncbi:MAG TPA: hypothetical protein VK663_08180 [Burkholderiales bacterium]|nr:hypothetical protein [Burkholderiales bacterium]
MKQFFAVVESLITVALVLAGLAGISYHSFREGGWLMQGISKMADAYISYPLIAVGLSIPLYFIYRMWRARRNQGRGGQIFDYLVYLFMAAGIYFIGHYVVTGKI